MYGDCSSASLYAISHLFRCRRRSGDDPPLGCLLKKGHSWDRDYIVFRLWRLPRFPPWGNPFEPSLVAPKPPSPPIVPTLHPTVRQAAPSPPHSLAVAGFRAQAQNS